MADVVVITTHELEPAVRLRDAFVAADNEVELITPGERLADAPGAALLVVTGAIGEKSAGRMVREAAAAGISTIVLFDSADDVAVAAGAGLAIAEAFIKPIDPATVVTVGRRLVERLRLRRFTGIIGETDAMIEVLERVVQIAPVNATVLVTGESGTGKERVARGIHALSSRRHRPFIAANVAAMPETLLESELFGHEKGAFTNAIERHLGCFEQADGGTLFLDEITEMAAEIQAKFLRVLEEHQVRRIGGNSTIPVSVRIVAATNRPPASAVKEGKLRQDLYYRLSVFHLELPPLRQRGEDLVLLGRYFLESFAEKYRRPVLPWAADFQSALRAHSWPGNVRELRNAMERLSILAPGPQLTGSDVQQFCLNAVIEEKSELPLMSLAQAERLAIENALTASEGNKTQAARLLGITPKTLSAKLALYGKEQ